MRFVVCLVTFFVAHGLWAQDALLQRLNPLFEDSVPPQVRHEVERTLRQIGIVRGDGASHLYRQIFGERVDGKMHVERFFKHVNEIRYSEADNGDLATASFERGGPAVGAVTIFASWVSASKGIRMGSIVHEVWHLKHQDSHAECTSPSAHPFSKNWTLGDESCDQTHDSAYGAEAIFLANLAKSCVNCGGESRKSYFKWAFAKAGRIQDKASRTVLVEDLFPEWFVKDAMENLDAKMLRESLEAHSESYVHFWGDPFLYYYWKGIEFDLDIVEALLSYGFDPAVRVKDVEGRNLVGEAIESLNCNLVSGGEVERVSNVVLKLIDRGVQPAHLRTALRQYQLQGCNHHQLLAASIYPKTNDSHEPKPLAPHRTVMRQTEFDDWLLNLVQTLSDRVMDD